MSAIALDPLIAEARHRARRRKLLALAGVMVAVAALGATLETRSSGNSLGVCATVPSGWKERTRTDPSVSPPTVVLTNFRFGNLKDFYGLSGRRNWPADGVTVAVSNVAASPARLDRDMLRLSAKDFGRLEGTSHPSGQIVVRSNARILNGYVEVGTLTPATIAAANRALTGVRTCSA